MASSVYKYCPILIDSIISTQIAVGLCSITYTVEYYSLQYLLDNNSAICHLFIVLYYKTVYKVNIILKK